MTKYVLMQALLCFFLSISLMPFCPGYAVDTYPQVDEAEYFLFGKTFEGKEIPERLSGIEKNLFKKIYENDSFDERITRIKSHVFGSAGKNNQNPYEQQGYENLQSQEINEYDFLNIVVEEINKQRSYKGLIPLNNDPLASRIASEHSSSLILKGYLSYFNLKGQGPDERYTLAGGTGATTEIIKGFQSDNNITIKLTELLAHQLVQAVVVNPDDSQIIYSPYISHIGFGYALSNDKKAFVSVIEFIAKGGEFEPVRPIVNFGEKIQVVGKILKPYKFKAVSLAYYDVMPDDVSNGSNNNHIYFDNENLMPYLLPQDYIAYGDTAKNNIAKVLKGIGAIGAIAGAPFTGGATAVLAPVFLSSIQSGPPREIPLKGGIKLNSKGEFTGELELNFQGKPGLYFISVLGEIPGVNYPVVISRRTIRVRSHLPFG
jgi:uncharacterized protein YkwD